MSALTDAIGEINWWPETYSQRVASTGHIRHSLPEVTEKVMV